MTFPITEGTEGSFTVRSPRVAEWQLARKLITSAGKVNIQD
jgi:hypothetical protein